ncbi:MAG: hypothetical protein DRQ51_07950 [Gammaproteobacteria bacterium]|nr:MAG: hypothetical protein DRQ51_07950 [Gammaproteobacteria bacterium]
MNIASKTNIKNIVVILLLTTSQALLSAPVISSYIGEYDFGNKTITAATTTIKFKISGEHATYSLDTQASILFSMFTNDDLKETSYLKNNNGRWQPYKYIYQMKKDDKIKSVKQDYNFQTHMMAQDYDGKKTNVVITDQTYDRVSILVGLAQLLQEKLTTNPVLKSRKMQMADFKEMARQTFVISEPKNIEVPYGKVKAYKISPVQKTGLYIYAYYAVIDSNIVLVKLEQYKNGKFRAQAELTTLK